MSNSDDVSQWQHLCDYNTLRNIIVHNAGIADDEEKMKKAQAVAQRTKLKYFTVEDNGEINVLAGFCEEALGCVVTFQLALFKTLRLFIGGSLPTLHDAAHVWLLKLVASDKCSRVPAHVLRGFRSLRNNRLFVLTAAHKPTSRLGEGGTHRAPRRTTQDLPRARPHGVSRYFPALPRSHPPTRPLRERIRLAPS